MKDFKVGDEVVWTSKISPPYIPFNQDQEKFLKSKEIHTITEIDIDGNCVCKLEGNDNWYDLTWFNKVEGDKEMNKKITNGMKSYIGTKLIEARPCTRGYFLKLTDKVPQLYKKEYMEEIGYIVKYKDGYISWSPKDVFEKAYMELDVNPQVTRANIDKQVTELLIGDK